MTRVPPTLEGDTCSLCQIVTTLVSIFMEKELEKEFTLAAPPIQVGGAGAEPLGFAVKKWYFQTERGSNPEPLKHQKRMLYPLRQPHLD